MNKQQALKAVETGCNHILQTAKSIENALILFDDFSNAILMWEICGMIDRETQQECTDFIYHSKELYRRSLAKR